jgi:hypothetical protein
MATDLKWLQGKIVSDPSEETTDLDRLLAGFLRALIEERRLSEIPNSRSDEPQSGAV